MEEVVFQRDTRSDGTEERNGQRQAGRGPYSMSSVRRMSQDAKSEAQEQERNHKRKRLPFPAMEKATFFLHAFRQLSEAKQKTTRYAGGKQKG